MNEHQPSTLKILWNDYWSFVAATSSIIAAGVFLYDTFIGHEPDPAVRLTMLGIFVISLAGGLARMASLRSLFEEGQEAKAIVNEVGFFRDRGQIRYIYTQAGQKYQGRMNVMKNRYTRAYRVGDEIAVIVDRENPRRSMIKDLLV